MSATLRRIDVAAFALLLAAAGCGSGSGFFGAASYWRPEPEGHVVVTAGSQPGSGTSVDLPHQLGLGQDNIWNGKIGADAGKQRFDLEYLPIHLHGSNTTDQSFVFHGANYPAGDRVTTDLNLDTWILKWEYALSANDKTRDALRVGLGAYWWHFESQVTGSPSGNDERRKFSHLYPSVNGSLTLDVGENVLIDLSGALATTGKNRRVYDYSGGLSYWLSDHLRTEIGYRWMLFDFNESTNDGDFGLRGPYAAIDFRF